MAIDTEAPAGVVFIAASGTGGTGTSFGANNSLAYSFCPEKLSSNGSTTMAQARSCTDQTPDLAGTPQFFAVVSLPAHTLFLNGALGHLSCRSVGACAKGFGSYSTGRGTR